MINYTVKKSKKTRISYRIAAAMIMLVPAMQISLYIYGYGRKRYLVLILCAMLFLYGIYLLIHTFRKTEYDITYHFGEDKITVDHRWGCDEYTYDQVTDVSQIIPEDERFYSIIHLTVGKEHYVIPFSYKKETADQIYEYLLRKQSEATL